MPEFCFWMEQDFGSGSGSLGQNIFSIDRVVVANLVMLGNPNYNCYCITKK